MKNKGTLLSISSMMLLIPLLLSADPIPVSYFAERPKFTQVKISPKGQYLAVTAPVNDQTVLITMDLETMKPIKVLRFGTGYHINTYDWANDERLVFTKVKKRGTHAQEANYGQIYAANFDGGKFKGLFGYDIGTKQAGTRINQSHKADWASAWIQSLLRHDSKNIIILISKWESDVDTPLEIHKLNIYSGKRKRIARTALGNGYVYVNEAGKPELMSGVTRKGENKVYRFIDKTWQAISVPDDLPQMIDFYKGDTEEVVYTHAFRENMTAAIFKYNINDVKFEMVYQNDVVDPEIMLHPTSGEAFGVVTYNDKLKYKYFDKNAPWSYTHRTLRGSFPGNAIDIVSVTDDGQKLIVLVSSDKDAGTYYLFDKEKSELRFLESRYSNIDPGLMKAKNPINFTSRDGETIRGFLTKPSEDDSRKFPLVVLVHGGPFGVQDTWSFDNEVQLLASRGYGVLQVNYRGSGGYGERYERSGWQKMGTLIQRDIIDGAKWATDTYSIDPKKVCIMGTSFGGYSALMAPIVEQGVFSCSIAISGVYDWVEQNQDADYVKVSSVKSNLDAMHGTEEILREQSPIHQLDRFTIPLFLVHGGQDQRTTPEQFDRLKKALKKQSAEFETLYKKEEGHGFFDPKNREELYTRALAFLDKHIGT